MRLLKLPMEYIVYFHIERNGLFLCRDKSFADLDSQLLCKWESVGEASKHIEDKDADKARCSLWKIGSQELKDWLDNNSKGK